MKLRRYNLKDEGPEPIFDLFERVYGDSFAIRQRWEWEWTQHPEAEKIHIFVADDKLKLIGMTVRMPINLNCNGLQTRGWFATNSMVDPDYRGRGVIRQLYEMANNLGGINLSKGTAPEMYRQLLSMNYKRVQPDTYQVCLIDPLRWVMRKIGFKSNESMQVCDGGLKEFSDYHQIDSFPPDLKCSIEPGLGKSSSWLNWRYVDIPHRSYHIMVREKVDRVVSWCVVRFHGQSCSLVDMCWSSDQKDEPMKTIRYVKAFAKSKRSVKITAWFSMEALRSELKKKYFFSRPETPYFSYLMPKLSNTNIQISHIHVVYGDNDTEYLVN